jgi:hypothetical protein
MGSDKMSDSERTTDSEMESDAKEELGTRYVEDFSMNLRVWPMCVET